MNLLAPFRQIPARNFSSSWRSPANIALVKYWGKKGPQLPANPSLSMTMKECTTESRVEFTVSDELKVELWLQGKSEEKFALKIKNYLQQLSLELPLLNQLQIVIQTKNTFPHGTGIASSASGLSAFCLALTDFLFQGRERDQNFYQVASYLSRLASGSACRSVYGGFCSWGEESDLFASQLTVHPELSFLHDAVMVVSAKEKSVSSRAGHDRMQLHAFAEARFVQAKNNYQLMKAALVGGDMEQVGYLMEMEALSLHAMMLTSPDSFVLLKPNSLAGIEMVRAFRAETKLPLYFTLDAGPNLHLMYPAAVKSKVETFIKHELAPLAENIIFDTTGEGPVPCP